MRKALKNNLLILLGWLFVALGLVGVILPILPTTPFLIVALALFSKSSPRFHQMLLNNAWFGSGLRRWEATKTMSRKNKYQASVVIVVTFSMSIAILSNKLELQVMLVCIAMALLFFIWRIDEDVLAAKSQEEKTEQ